MSVWAPIWLSFGCHVWWPKLLLFTSSGNTIHVTIGAARYSGVHILPPGIRRAFTFHAKTFLMLTRVYKEAIQLSLCIFRYTFNLEPTHHPFTCHTPFNNHYTSHLHICHGHATVRHMYVRCLIFHVLWFRLPKYTGNHQNMDISAFCTCSVIFMVFVLEGSCVKAMTFTFCPSGWKSALSLEKYSFCLSTSSLSFWRLMCENMQVMENEHKLCS